MGEISDCCPTPFTFFGIFKGVDEDDGTEYDFRKDGTRQTSKCCTDGSQPIYYMGSPIDCCPANKIVFASDKSTDGYIEVEGTLTMSICCGDDGGTLAQNMTNFAPILDISGIPTGCCDLRNHNTGTGSGDYSKQQICYIEPQVVLHEPGTGKPICATVGSGSGANSGASMQKIDPNKVLEEYGLFSNE